MKASDLIKELQAVVNEFGDLEVLTSMYSEADNKNYYDDFEMGWNCVYEIEDGDEYIGKINNLTGDTLIISHGEY